MATTADAELILKLYDLRREPVCREARRFFVGWTPKDADEAKSVGTNFALAENAYVRQVCTYWEMAFSIANLGAIHDDLFAKNCGEGIICTLKCQHLAKKFAGAWTRSMPEGEEFIGKNAIAKQKAEAIAKRYGY
jgi:hypothetical protein